MRSSDARLPGSSYHRHTQDGMLATQRCSEVGLNVHYWLPPAEHSEVVLHCFKSAHLEALLCFRSYAPFFTNDRRASRQTGDQIDVALRGA